MGVKWHGAGRRAVMVGALVAATLGLFSMSPAAEFKMGSSILRLFWKK